MGYPKKIVTDVLWNFENKKYHSLQEFVIAILTYNEHIFGDDFEFEKDANILENEKVVIQYFYWDEEKGDNMEPYFVLNADNNQFFTKSELLFKVHNAVFEQLHNKDNNFFEGFLLWEGENPNNPNIPLYFMIQGS